MRWYRVNVPGLGNVFVQAGSSQEAVTRARGVAQNQGVNLGTGDTETASLTATPTSGPQGSSGFVYSESGGIQSMSDYLGAGGTQGPTTGPGDPNEGSSNPTGQTNDPTGPDIGAGDDDDTPTATTGFWRINVPGYGNVFYSGTQADALSAAQQFIQSRGLQVGDTDISNMSPVQTNQDNYNSGLRVGLDGAVQGGEEGSWLDQPAQPAGGTGQGGTGGEGMQPVPPFPEGEGPNMPGSGESGILIDPEEASVTGAYRNFISGQGYNPNSVLGSLLANQQGQLEGSYYLQGLIGALDQPIEGDDSPVNQQTSPTGFIDYLSTTGRDQRAQMSLDALQTIASGQLGASDVNEEGNALSILALLQGTNPESAGGFGDFTGEINATAQQALETRYSPIIARRYGRQLTSQAEDLYSQELARHAEAGVEAPTYLSALLGYLGLS